jgi:hypothetical protein
MRHHLFLLALLLNATPGMLCGQTLAVVPAAADATLYEDPSGSLANGSGPGFFVGVNGRGERRRSMLRFDLTGIPPSAQVVDVELRLFVSRSNWAPALPIALHRALASWGEGPSVSGGGGGAGGSAHIGDATWRHRFWPSTPWQNLGGDMAVQASAVAATPQLGTAVWNRSPALLTDLQTWLDQPATNHGWLLRSAELGPGQVRRFDSREEVASPQPPELRVHYILPGQSAAIGTACGAPALTFQLSGPPLRGNSVVFAVGQGTPGALAACFFGFGMQPTSAVLPGCTLWPAQPFTPGLHIVDNSGAFQESVQLPLDPSFSGLPLAAQALTLNPTTAALHSTGALLAVIL